MTDMARVRNVRNRKERIINQKRISASTIAGDIRAFERHDKLIVLGLMAIFVGIIATIIQPADSIMMSNIRGGLMDLALLLLIADVIIHVGDLERKRSRD